jgi:ABC transporter substrate binding protein (PQQ-dependent alcohol dehydrogenase system)
METSMKGRIHLPIMTAAALGLLAAGSWGQSAWSQASQPAAASIEIVYLALAEKRALPLSYLDQPPADEGLQGARLGRDDNQTTGQFTGQSFHLQEAVEPDEASVVDAFKKSLAAGVKLFVTDLPASLLLRVADLPEAKNATILDAADRDDQLRGANCRRNVLHTMPSRAMLADALMQYLTIKKWTNIVLVVGMDSADKEYADAIRASARKFRIRLTKEINWDFDPGARRTDTGHYSVEAEVARMTQSVGSYDVLVVADEADNFGDELSYRTTDPRPVAGTEGLVPASWARPYEEQGATQLQGRFLKLTGRWMTERDYAAWLAVRVIGEAATTGGNADPAAIGSAMRGKDFGIAAYKGPKLSFRDWDGQLRQPVLLVDERSLVSVSPQPGFLHPVSELDTLGIDQPETKCHFQ